MERGVCNEVSATFEAGCTAMIVNTRRTVMIAATLLLISGLGAQPAQADDGHHGYFSFYRGWGPNVYSSGQLPVPPYFAVHPPVYYGLHMVRHYGYSPFTCPCAGPIMHYSQPAVIRVIEDEQTTAVPARIANHYVTEEAMVANKAHGPQRILNPYLVSK